MNNTDDRRKYYAACLVIASIFIASIVATAYTFITTRNYASFLLLVPTLASFKLGDSESSDKERK